MYFVLDTEDIIPCGYDEGTDLFVVKKRDLYEEDVPHIMYLYCDDGCFQVITATICDETRKVFFVDVELEEEYDEEDPYGGDPYSDESSQEDPDDDESWESEDSEDDCTECSTSEGESSSGESVDPNLLLAGMGDDPNAVSRLYGYQ